MPLNDTSRDAQLKRALAKAVGELLENENTDASQIRELTSFAARCKVVLEMEESATREILLSELKQEPMWRKL